MILATYKIKPEAVGSVKKLAEYISVHGYGWNGGKNYSAFIMDQGQGKVLVSELYTKTWKSDPIAARTFANMVSWAME